MYIDTHAHLTDGAFDDDRQELIKGLAAGGIGKIIEISCDPKDFPVSAALAEKNPGIYLAFGIHPEFAESCTESDIAALEKYLRHPKCVALGEIGLDYYWDKEHKALQQEMFERQIHLALELDLPVIVHDRQAHEDCLEMVLRYPALRGVFHCFSGSAPMAQELVRRGWYLGFDGPVTYKNNRKAGEVLAVTPLERILAETDSPYMAPVPYRGRRNDSSLLGPIVECLAAWKGVSPDEMARITRENGCRLFSIPPD